MLPEFESEFPFTGGLNGDEVYPSDFYEEQAMFDAMSEDEQLIDDEFADNQQSPSFSPSN